MSALIFIKIYTKIKSREDGGNIMFAYANAVCEALAARCRSQCTVDTACGDCYISIETA